MDLQTIILGIAGAVLSIAFSYIPELKAWFEAQKHQGLVMLGLVTLVGGVYFGLGCTSLAAQLQIAIACSLNGGLDLVRVVVTIAIGNQLTYLFSPRPS